MKRLTSADEHFSDAIINSLQEALITIDLNDCILTMNAGAENLCGFSNSGSYGKHISTLLGSISLESGEVIEKTVVHALSHGPFSWKSSGVKQPSSAKLPVGLSGTATPLAHPGKNPFGAVLLFRESNSSSSEDESRFGRVLDSMLQGCQIIGYDWRYKYLNKAAAAHGHQASGELIGKTMMEVYPGIEDTELFLTLSHCMKSREARRFDNHFIYPDGSEAWFELSIQPAMEGLFILSVDISGRILAEKELHNSLDRELFLANLVRDASVAISVGYPDGRLGMHNLAFEKLTGYTGDELRNIKWNEVLTPPEFLEPEKKYLDGIASTGKSITYEKEYIHKSGIRVPVELVVHPVFSDAGSISHYYAFVTDLTERKKAEESIRKTLSKYKTLFDNFPLGITVSDQDGKISETNSNAEKLLGLTREEQLGREIYDREWEIIRPDGKPMNPEEFASVIALKTGKRVENVEMGVVKPDQSITWINVTAAPDPLGQFGVIITYNDISARVNAEEKLRIQKELFDKITASAPGIICSFHQSLDGTTSMPYASYAAYDVYGIDPLAIKDDMSPVFSKVHPDDLSHVVESINRSAENMEMWQDEFRYQHPVKGEVWIGGQSMPVKEADGSITWHGFIADVTDKKLAAEKLRQSETRAQAMLNAIPDLMFRVSREGRILDYQAETRVLYDQENPLIGRTNKEIMPPDLATLIDNEIERTLSKLSLNTFDYQMDIPGMGIQDFEARMVPSGTDEVIAVIRNITDRKRAEEKILRTEKRYRSLIENAPDGIVLVDVSGRFTYVSPSVERIFGYTSDEVPGADANLLTHPDDLPYVIAELTKVINDPSYIPTLEYRFLHKNGDWKWIESTFSNLLNVPDLEGISINFRDIHERKLAEERLLKAKEKAEESERLKSAFLTNMSHEIRTPMNGILGFAGLLETPDITESDRAEYIEIIRQSGDRMLNTINDLIEISSIETGAVAVVEAEANINEMLRFLYNFFELQAAQKGLQLSCTTPLPDDRATIITDKNKLDSILINLIRNAVKFTQRGSVTFGYKARGGMLEFYVSDTGIGIPADRLEAIFERFVQADLNITRPYEGSGLGLSISRAYVEMLGGQIRVESMERAGSTFRFTIPWKAADIPTEQKLPDEESREQHLLLNGTVLVAEDDEISFRLLQKIFTPICRSVIRAGTGTEAVELCLHDQSISFVLMDIKMPEMDGYEATRRIREFNSDVVIVAQTAYALEGERRKALESGFDDYIPKPFDAAKITDLIKRNLNRRVS